MGASLALVLLGCSKTAESVCASDAELVIEDFIGAMDSGDATAADAVFADNSFGWFSETPGRLDPEARQRDTLTEYLEGRIQQGASYELTSFSFTGYRETSGLGDFGLVLTNESNERIDAKGAIDCDTGKIIVLSLGRPQ